MCGGKVYKSDFVRKMFMNDASYIVLPVNPSADTMSAYDHTFKSFKAKHAKAITARNYLLQLYNEASSRFYQLYIDVLQLITLQYGSSVLFDVVWNVRTFMNSTKSFKSTLSVLSSGAVNVATKDSKHIVLALLAETDHCLHSVLFVMGGAVMVDYYSRFSSHFPPDMNRIY